MRPRRQLRRAGGEASCFISATTPVGRQTHFDRLRTPQTPTAGDDLSLAAVTEAIGLSPFHLLRGFPREFGLSPATYENLLRVMEAPRRLLGGEQIAQVAAEVGLRRPKPFDAAYPEGDGHDTGTLRAIISRNSIGR
ncbi:MAG TPA: AraC family transcriptional regulator [Allosphingosinicella sp.]|jgi:AraC-like DNA-binding protein